MKKIIFGALAILSLSACSDEETLIRPKGQNEITFNAVIGNPLTRGVTGYCNNNKPLMLRVWASVPDGSGFKPYFTEQTVSYSNDFGDYKITGRYWPESTVRFFAIPWSTQAVNSGTLSWKSDYSTIILPLSNPSEPSQQDDLIYAATGDVTPTYSDVDQTYYSTLYFRHAMSQVEFRAKTTNSNYYVEISAVKVSNIYQSGVYELPIKTNGVYDPHHGGSSTYKTDRGTWSDLQAGTKNYSLAEFDAVSFTKTNGIVSLTEEDTEPYGDLSGSGSANASDIREFNKNTMYLIPQKAAENGAKFGLKIKVWQIANASVGHQDTDVVVADYTTDFMEIAVPNNWEEGKKYVYTFDIKNVVTSETPNITFGVTCDDFYLDAQSVVTTK